MAQPVHVQQLLKLKQQAVQQQKAIQPQAAPGPAAVQQKVLAPRVGSCRPGRALGMERMDSRKARQGPFLASQQPHTQKTCAQRSRGGSFNKALQGEGGDGNGGEP